MNQIKSMQKNQIISEKINSVQNILLNVQCTATEEGVGFKINYVLLLSVLRNLVCIRSPCRNDLFCNRR